MPLQVQGTDEVELAVESLGDTRYVEPQDAVGGVAGQALANNGVFSGPKQNLSFPGWDKMFGWLPLLLQGRGLDPLHAGLYASLVTLCQAPGALVTATLAARARDQRVWIVGIPGMSGLAFVVLAFGAEGLRIPAACILGFGVGGCFGLALTLIVLRAADAGTAAGLSAMAQGIGYVFAALGPLAFGLAHEATGGWGLAGALFAGICVAAILAGLPAGAPRTISATG